MSCSAKKSWPFRIFATNRNFRLRSFNLLTKISPFEKHNLLYLFCVEHALHRGLNKYFILLFSKVSMVCREESVQLFFLIFFLFRKVTFTEKGNLVRVIRCRWGGLGTISKFYIFFIGTVRTNSVCIQYNQAYIFLIIELWSPILDEKMKK